MSRPLIAVGAPPAADFGPLHTERATVPWSTGLADAASRLRRLGELMAFQVADPAIEVIAIGRLVHTTTGRPVASEPPGAPGSLGFNSHNGLAAVEQAVSLISIPDQEDDLETALFGFLSYEASWGLDGTGYRRPQIVPDHLFFLPRVLIRHTGSELIIASRDHQPHRAERALRHVLDLLAGPDRCDGAPAISAPPIFTRDRSEFRRAVRIAHRHILDGDVFQLVLSLGCVFPVYRTDPVWLHGRLNPDACPMLFSYQGPALGAVGGSSELFLRVDGDSCRVRPVSGSVACGVDAAGYRSARNRLLASDTEAAKHRMVIDQVRNDLGKVCSPGTVNVTGMNTPQRSSNLMQLSADVAGILEPGRGPIDAIRATFPPTTVTGSPKSRARQLIHGLDGSPRGLFGGVVGLVSQRRALLYQLGSFMATTKPGRVHLRAGTTVVHDSDPHQLYDHCRFQLEPIAALLGAVV